MTTSTINKPELQNTFIIQLLEKWGWWYHNENKTIDLGYPKTASFVNERVDGLRRDAAGYVSELDENQALPLMIHDGLMKDTLFMKIAKISYGICRRGCSISDKANLLKHEGYYLGSSKEACRKKYAQLEDNLHCYMAGFVNCYENN